MAGFILVTKQIPANKNYLVDLKRKYHSKQNRMVFLFYK